MALGYNTEGYGFSPQFASGANAALGELKPLEVAGTGGVVPMSITAPGVFKPLTFNTEGLFSGGPSQLRFEAAKPPAVVNAHPEAIGQAVAQGLGELTKGITAAYLSRRESDKKALAEGRKKAPFAAGFSEDKDLGLVPKAGAVDPSVDAVAFNAKLDELSKHIENSTGRKPAGRKGRRGGAEAEDAPQEGVSGVPSEYKPADQAAPSAPSAPLPSPSVFTPRSPILQSVRLPAAAPVEKQSKKLGALSPSFLENPEAAANPLGISYAPEYATASTEPGPVGPVNPGQEGGIDYGQLLQNISAYTTPAATPQPALAAVPAPTPAAAPVNEKFEAEVRNKIAGPRYSEGQAKAIQDYMEATGRGRPQIKEYAATKTHPARFAVDWSSPEKQATAATKTETTQQNQAKRLDLQAQRLVDAEASKFYMHPAIKAFTAPNGMQQSFTRFVKNYDAIAKNPEAAGISDIGLLDMYARAEGGGRVTEGQAALVLQSMGLTDKAKVMGMRLEGGDKLSQNQRDQMMRVIADDHVAQARLANQAVKFYRDRLKASGVTDEGSLPQPFVTPITKWEAKDQLDEMRKEAIALKAQKDAAARSGADASEADAKLRELGEKAQELAKKMRSSKSMIINMDEIENTPQGWGGGAVMAIPTLPTAPAGQ